jgi:hypothetical protein
LSKKLPQKLSRPSEKKIRTGCSQRNTASASNLTVSHVNYIRKHKKFKRPLMTDQEKAQLRPKCRKLLNKYRGYNFIIDDESYFTLSHTTQLRKWHFLLKQHSKDA